MRPPHRRRDQRAQPARLRRRSGVRCFDRSQRRRRLRAPPDLRVACRAAYDGGAAEPIQGGTIAIQGDEAKEERRMRFLVINPNTTEAMTRDIEAEARRYARPDTFDGVAIACYGDPGLYAARELSPVPVVGIAEASMHMACMVAHKFSVVTVLPRIRPLLEDVVRRYGFEARCASVRTTSLAVLDIEQDPDAARREIAVEGRRAVEEDGAEALCLGCAGMGPLDKGVESEVGVPVIDGVAAAVKMLEGLTDYGMATSRVAAFKEPEAKELKGDSDVIDAFRAKAPA